MESVTLTQREQQRLAILNEVERGHLQIEEAAELIAVTTRQVRRLLAAYRAEGAAALAHGNRGRKPENTIDEEIRRRVVELAQTTYAGCNQVHLTDLLAEREEVCLSRSTIRRILLGAGMRSPRTRRAPKHRSRRDRSLKEGMLLQVDGSRHAWLEDRGPWMTLVAGIDDATGQVAAAIFRDQEDAAGYLLMLQQVCTTRGIPLAAYHDRHGIFGLPPAPTTLDHQLAGKRTEPTQVERVFQDLAMGSIPARSPQAKGRVERLFGTLQDRLVSELRLAGITTMEAANAFLPGFLLRHNERFAVPAADPARAYRPWPTTLDPAHVFCFKYERTVAADNTVRLGEHRLQLLPSTTRPSYARCRVTLHEHLDGAISVHYQGQVIATKEAPAEAPVLRARGGDRPGSSQTRGESRTADMPQPPDSSDRPARTERKPAADHIWRAGYEQRMAAKAAKASRGQNS
jgi:transposase